MRLLICAGGTGGGVYPALTVLQTLGDEAQPVLWVGGEAKMDAELVQRKNVPFTSIPAAGVHGVGLRTLPGNVIRLVRGYLAARRVLRQFRPDVMLFTGGYVAVPVALAGRGIPSLLYVPDIEPGLALKTLARFASRIALTTPTSTAHFPKDNRLVVTGYPIRPDLQPVAQDVARRALGLDPQRPVVAFFGGSSGARSINRAVLAALPNLLEHTQVLHVTGRLDWEEIQAARSALTEQQQSAYVAFPYLHEEMSYALSAPDLVLSRAGASVLGEYPVFGLPSILVPYPYAWRYQKVNADYLIERGAAVLLEDARLNTELLPTVLNLLNDRQRLEAMRQAVRAQAQPGAAQRLADQVRTLAASSSQKGKLTAW